MTLEEFLMDYLNCVSVVKYPDDSTDLVLTVLPHDEETEAVTAELRQAEDLPNAVQLLHLVLCGGEAEYEGRERVHALLNAAINLVEYAWELERKLSSD